jgi:hypothetical protein
MSRRFTVVVTEVVSSVMYTFFIARREAVITVHLAMYTATSIFILLPMCATVIKKGSMML